MSNLFPYNVGDEIIWCGHDTNRTYIGIIKEISKDVIEIDIHTTDNSTCPKNKKQMRGLEKGCVAFLNNSELLGYLVNLEKYNPHTELSKILNNAYITVKKEMENLQ